MIHIRAEQPVKQSLQWEVKDLDNELRPGKYRHFKGKEYELICTATHSETMEPMVVYRALYGEFGVWVRPLSMWNQLVEVSGEKVPRFKYIGGEKD